MAVPILVQMYPLKTVVPVMVLIDLCASLYLGRKSSKDANKEELIWLFPFTLVGMAVGIALLVNAPSEPLLIALGFFAAGNGVRVLLQKGSAKHRPINKWWAMPFGFCGGAFTALFATGGPIYASYLGFRFDNPLILRATMAFAIFMLTFLRLAFMLATGLILSWSVLSLAVSFIPAMVVGIWCGSHVHSKMSQRAMRLAYGSLLVMAGLMLLARQLI